MRLNPVKRSLVPLVPTPVHATPAPSLAAGFMRDQGRRPPLCEPAEAADQLDFWKKNEGSLAHAINATASLSPSPSA